MGTMKKLASERTDFEIQEDLLVRYTGSKILVDQLPEEVVRIGKNAFDESPVEVLDLSTSGVRRISEEAFYLHPSLKTIILPGLEEIGPDAFRDCESLQTVECRGSIGEIGEQAFMGCRQLKELSFAQIGRIGRWAFLNCESLQKVNFSGMIEEIADEAFFCCHGLKEITFADAGKMGDCVFFECRELERVLFAGSVERIGEEAFRNCPSLRSVEFRGPVEAIALGAFSYCRNLTEVAFDEGSIEEEMIDNAFWTTSYTKAGGLEQHPEGSAPWYLLWKMKKCEAAITALEEKMAALREGRCPYCGGAMIRERQRLFRPEKILCGSCGRPPSDGSEFAASIDSLQQKIRKIRGVAREHPVFADMLEAYDQGRRPEPAGSRPAVE